MWKDERIKGHETTYQILTFNFKYVVRYLGPFFQAIPSGDPLGGRDAMERV
jgi:hypothetical protein